MTQPITATQLAVQMEMSAKQCSHLLFTLAKQQLLVCLNPNARRSRLFWLTEKGIAKQQEMGPIFHDLPGIDWAAYGSICFSHRSIVVRTLTEPMQPAQIKRKALRNNAKIRFSANNCRDTIRFLKACDIVNPGAVGKKKYVRYELTEQGKHMQRLLWQAEVMRF